MLFETLINTSNALTNCRRETVKLQRYDSVTEWEPPAGLARMLCASDAQDQAKPLRDLGEYVARDTSDGIGLD